MIVFKSKSFAASCPSFLTKETNSENLRIVNKSRRLIWELRRESGKRSGWLPASSGPAKALNIGCFTLGARRGEEGNGVWQQFGLAQRSPHGRTNLWSIWPSHAFLHLGTDLMICMFITVLFLKITLLIRIDVHGNESSDRISGLTVHKKS